jgi:hypothetical protein
MEKYRNNKAATEGAALVGFSLSMYEMSYSKMAKTIPC